MSEENKKEENYVVVVDQAPAPRQGVESKTSKRGDESRPPRTPRLPSVKSTKPPEPEKPNEIKTDIKVPKNPFVVVPQGPAQETSPLKESPEDKIAELKTHQENVEWVPQESSHSQDTSRTINKKALTWSDDGYLQKVCLKSMAETSGPLEVERRASVGLHKSATAFRRRPSGLTIVVPKKSTKNITDFNTGINISISKKSIPLSKSGVVISSSSADVKSRGDAAKLDEKRAVKVDIEVPYKKIFNVVRSKLDFVRNKFYSVRPYLNSS